MFVYEQSSGKFSQDGVYLVTGYSGWDDGDNIPEPGEGKNNPDAQAVKNVGPIPVGQYNIGPVYDHPTKGPVVMRLTPKVGTEAFGRSAFLIHGDSVHAPGTASHGCIILPRKIRERVAASGDTDLEVV